MFFRRDPDSGLLLPQHYRARPRGLCNMLVVNQLSGFSSFLGSAPATWDPAFINASNNALSNGNLTVTALSQNVNSVVRSTTSKSAGLKYFEVTAVNFPVTSPGERRFGICNATLNVGQQLGGDTNGVGGSCAGSGPWFINNADTGVDAIGTQIADGAVIACAVNFNTLKIWGRGDAGWWNQSGTSNPATDTEGVDISSITGPYFAAFNTYGLLVDEEILTVNFGATAFTYTVPSGFSAWNS